MSDEDGKTMAAVVVNDSYDAKLQTMLDGGQWVDQPITPGLAQIIIKVLQQYLDEGLPPEDKL